MSDDNGNVVNFPGVDQGTPKECLEHLLKEIEEGTVKADRVLIITDCDNYRDERGVMQRGPIEVFYSGPGTLAHVAWMVRMADRYIDHLSKVGE